MRPGSGTIALFARPLAWLLVATQLAGGAARAFEYEAYRDCIRGTLQQEIDYVREGHLTPEDQAKIASILARKDLLMKDQARQIFEVHLESRLRTHPELRAIVKKALDQAQKDLLTEDDSVVHASVSSRNDGSHQIKLEMQKEFYGTAIEYFLLLHEIDHVITIEAAASRLPPEQAGALNNLQGYLLGDTELYRAIEATAIMTEGHYHQSFPISVRQELAGFVRRTAKLSYRSKDFLSRTLTTETPSPGRYLDQEWAAGRYNETQIKEIIRENQGLPPKQTGRNVATVTAATLLATAAACEVAIKSYPDSAAAGACHSAGDLLPSAETVRKLLGAN